MNHTLLLFFSCLWMAINTLAQDTLHKRTPSIIIGAQLSTYPNIGPVHKQTITEYYNNHYSEILTKPLFCGTAGLEMNNYSILFDVGKFSKQGQTTTFITKNQFQSFYLSGEITYSFLNKKPHVLVPSISINYAVVKNQFDVQYNYDPIIESKSSKSKAHVIQLPVGLSFSNKFFFTKLSYNVPVISWIKGSIHTRYNNTLNWYERSFSAMGTDKDVFNNYEIFTFRIGIKLSKSLLINYNRK